ncbi:MAG: branched-chain amino acid ABC transporter permease, partial [Actinobacteria bacterium]|nr:branched-chain amino acid ABC transporter permease [Actinomycetota bacterium]
MSSDGKPDRSSWLFWAMAGVIAIVIPIIAGTPFLLATMVAFFIYLTWNTMWGLVLGTAGLHSFATVAVAGIAGYATAYMTIDIANSNAAAAGAECSGNRLLGLPVVDWWLAIPIAAVVGLGVGFLISLPAIRLRGIYFALLTIGLVELCRAYTGQDKCNLGGAQGLFGASSFIPSDMMGSAMGYRYAYAAAVLLAIVALLIYWKVNYGRLGLLLRTARESEPVAEVLGVDVVRARMWVFLISSSMLGAAGGFYVSYYKSISPN